jgi:hypothetical protein
MNDVSANRALEDGHAPARSETRLSRPEETPGADDNRDTARVRRLLSEQFDRSEEIHSATR